MGLRQPVTVETESSGIEGGNLWRKTLELKKEEEGEGKEEGKGGEEILHSVAACISHTVQ